MPSGPMIPRAQFLRRLFRNIGLTLGVLLAALGVGVVGYHASEPQLSWLDALLNASMILGGMGPVDRMTTSGGKLFASLYALFSGVILLGSVGVMLGPVYHRVLHRFHVPSEQDEQDEEDEQKGMENGARTGRGRR
jgi:hypothetical protein